jgi:glycosyltransferase involved in cell wall biosynthesis
VDVSAIVVQDHKTGIQRTVKSLLDEFVDNYSQDFHIEPVYLSSDGGTFHYKYARDWYINSFKNLDFDIVDKTVDFYENDVLLLLDFDLPNLINNEVKILHQKLISHRTSVFIIIYDLLPITFPKFFPSFAHDLHKKYIEAALNLSGAFCISKAVKNDLKDFYSLKVGTTYALDNFTLGSDIKKSVPCAFPIKNKIKHLNAIQKSTSFIMVGTIEPRKGHNDILESFELLWKKGVDANLVIVGKKGWLINELVEKIEKNSFLEQKLFWFESADDHELEELYKASDCLIAASYCEGFGLPIIEAAIRGLPLFVRETNIFREVASDNAYYFNERSTNDEIALSIECWLDLYHRGGHPQPKVSGWPTWSDSANQLMTLVKNNT